MSIRASLWRRFFASVVAGLMLGALLPAHPAAAATEACPTTLPKHTFTDLGGLTGETVEAITCIAYYGIAQGTGATTFSPSLDVPRWQMALFLIRTAQDLSIPLPNGAPQGFTDLGGLDSGTVVAINQLTQLGITRGTGPGTFTPGASVPRWQMALFLTRLHAKAGLALPSGAHQGFTDIGAHDAATQQAINQLAQLGIARGTSIASFSPTATVPRWQMALFLARQLEAGRAAPYVMTLSLDPAPATVSTTVVATITVRDASGRPVGGRSVDVFVGGFNANGTCSLDSDARIGGGDAATGTDCTIDKNDPKTNAQGQLAVQITHTNRAETDTVVAWIGEPGERFDNDTVRTRSIAQLVWTAAPSALVVDDRTFPFGTTGTVTASFRDGSGKPVAAAGQRIVFTVSRGRAQILKQTTITDATGSAALSYLGPPDPSPAPDPAVVDSVKAFWDLDGDGIDDGAAELDDTATVSWDDADPIATAANIAQSAVSHLGGQQNTVTVTVRDNLGRPVPGAKVTIKLAGATTATQVATTNASGSASHTYTGPAGQGVDTIDAAVDLDGDGTLDPGDVASVGAISHYWVQQAPDLPGTTKFDLVRADSSARTIDVRQIGGAQNLYRLSYDASNDLFSVNDEAAGLTEFESALSSLTLPDLDGDGKTELMTSPYTTVVAAASVFVLTK